jgi:hypothetical protein
VAEGDGLLNRTGRHQGSDETGQNSRFPVNIPRLQFCPVSPDPS